MSIHKISCNRHIIYASENASKSLCKCPIGMAATFIPSDWSDSISLDWSVHINSNIKKAQQRMYFLRRLKSFNLDIRILTNFSKCVIESTLTYSIIIWYNAATKEDIKKINSVISVSSDDQWTI